MTKGASPSDRALAALSPEEGDGDPEDLAEDTEEEEYDVGLQQAADEIMAAVKDGDTKALMGALRAFHEMC